MLSKKPSRTFISIKPRVRFKAIRHYLDEHSELRTAFPPRRPWPAVVCPSVDSEHLSHIVRFPPCRYRQSIHPTVLSVINRGRSHNHIAALYPWKNPHRYQMLSCLCPWHYPEAHIRSSVDFTACSRKCVRMTAASSLHCAIDLIALWCQFAQSMIDLWGLSASRINFKEVRFLNGVWLQYIHPLLLMHPWLLEKFNINWLWRQCHEFLARDEQFQLLQTHKGWHLMQSCIHLLCL